MGKLQEHHLENVGERETHRIDPEHYERFRDPERLDTLRPEELVGAFDVGPGDTVLDVGCGDGLLFEPLSHAVGREGMVIGLEIEPDLVKRSRETIDIIDRDNIRVLRVRNDEVDLPTNSADAATLVNTLHEMASPRRSLAELHRVLRPGGRVLIFDRHKEETGPDGPPIHHLISQEEARQLMNEAGFDYESQLEWDPAMYCLIFRNQD